MMLIALVAAATLAQLRAAPNEIRAFVEQREGCTHWAGEEPYDKERAQEIAVAIKTLRCDRLAKEEAGLRRQYKHRPDLLDLLAADPDE